MGSDKKIIQGMVQRDFVFLKNIYSCLYAVGNIPLRIEKSLMQEWKCSRTVWERWEDMGSKFQVEELAFNTMFHFGNYSIMLRKCIDIIVLYAFILNLQLKKENSAK